MASGGTVLVSVNWNAAGLSLVFYFTVSNLLHCFALLWHNTEVDLTACWLYARLLFHICCPGCWLLLYNAL